MYASQLIQPGLIDAGVERSAAENYLGSMNSEQFDTSVLLVTDILMSSVEHGVSPKDVSSDAQRRLDSALYGAGKSTGKVVVAFNLTQTFKETYLPVAVLASTILSGQHLGLKDTISLSKVLTSFWSNFVILKQPDDDHAIRVVRAIGVVILEAKASYARPEASNLQIATRSELTLAEVAAGLKRVIALGLVENLAWGGQADDLVNENNLWKLTF